MTGAYFLVILFFFGLATGIVGKIKGSSFLIWFLVGFCLPVVGPAGRAPLPLGARRAADAVPALRRDREDHRPGLHAVRRGHRVGPADDETSPRGRRSPAVRRRLKATRCSGAAG